ncbi:hypothetical protein LI82_02675 [Methanococcoides methylutens]|uniref:Uncharacterized protein n=1 Tax=Methanococcoides methylutens TaxID=2226 RepID=A0A099T223_METMT|nr:hypothetical protein [Methanococcoides methylutens]KGK98964.1 hypothetical protein LI82_02675 [Methanococcoides methylutens]
MVLELLNEYNSALTLFFSFVVAASTVVYAILTWRLVSETRKTREAQIKPHVSVSFEQSNASGSPGLLDMVMENLGEGPAYDLQFEVTPDFEMDTVKLSEVGFIKNGLRYLGPSQKIRFFLTSLYENYEQKKDNPFEIIVTYKDGLEKKHSELYVIDFSQFSGIGILGTPPLIRIADSLEIIVKDLSKLSSKSQKFNVITQPIEDFREEEHERRERQKAMLAECKKKK